MEPLSAKLKTAIRGIVTQYLNLKATVTDLKQALTRSQERERNLAARLTEVKSENAELRESARDYVRVKNALGQEQTDSIISKSLEAERASYGTRTNRARDTQAR
jgi:predicted nuclease with TOPRIM domain